MSVFIPIKPVPPNKRGHVCVCHSPQKRGCRVNGIFVKHIVTMIDTLVKEAVQCFGFSGFRVFRVFVN